MRNIRVRKKKLYRMLGVIIATTVFVTVVVAGISSAAANHRIEAIFEAEEKIETDFKNNIAAEEVSTPMQQDQSIPGLVLLNVGDKDPSDFKSKDIRNIFVMLFEKTGTYGRINIVAMQKEIMVKKSKNNEIITLQKSFNKDNPEEMYEAIEKQIDYKVNNYLAYGDETIKSVMDKCTKLNACVQVNEPYKINDIPILNKNIKKYAKKYNVKNYETINNPGIQALNTIQMIAFVNLYADVWDCCWNDWRQMDFIYRLTEELKNRNLGELEEMSEILLRGENDFKNDYRIKVGAALRAYRLGSIDRWPHWEVPEMHKGVQYRIPSDYMACINMLHKDSHDEKTYTPSKKLLKYIAELTDIHNYISAYAQRQDAQKRAEEEAIRMAAEEEMMNTVNAADEANSNKDNLEAEKKKSDKKKSATKKTETGSATNKDKNKTSTKEKSSNNKENKDGGSKNGSGTSTTEEIEEVTEPVEGENDAGEENTNTNDGEVNTDTGVK